MFAISIYKSCVKWQQTLSSGHTPPSQVFYLDSFCRYIFHMSGDILKRVVSLGSLTKRFPVNAKTTQLKLQMLIASMLSDSG